MKFNKYINKIGIEFEGYFAECTIIDGKFLVRSVGEDASLSNSTPSHQGKELRTNPLDENQVENILSQFAGNVELIDKYRIDHTVGLHYHISFNKNYYAHLVNMDFYDAYVEMFAKNFPKVFESRKNNRYCYADIRKTYADGILESTWSFAVHPNTMFPVDMVPEGRGEHINENNASKKHFKKQSQSKYAFINYQNRAHNTIEFRPYGGKHATVRGLGECIQATIDLIGEFIPKHSLKLFQKVERDTGKKAYKKEIDVERIVGKYKNQWMSYAGFPNSEYYSNNRVGFWGTIAEYNDIRLSEGQAPSQHEMNTTTVPSVPIESRRVNFIPFDGDITY